VVVHPDKILEELGITEPRDIDLDAIAWHLGAKVRYRPLDGCEARIVGAGDRAIITVNNRNTTLGRQRFSLAHEIGHWIHHRGQRLPCETDGRAHGAVGRLDPERIADRFAVDLLMPSNMIKPMVSKQAKINFQIIRSIADAFGTSQTATAIRLVDGNHLNAILVCHGLRGRKWFTRAKSVPERWFPQDALSAESFAFDVLFSGKAEDGFLRKIGADAWFDRWDAQKYEIQEQSIRIGDGEIVTLLVIADEEMLAD